jgi:hypothetical protein
MTLQFSLSIFSGAMLNQSRIWPYNFGIGKQEKAQLRTKINSGESCFCETQKLENRVSHIFLIGSFLEFCKNMRKSKMGWEFRIFISYVQPYQTES